MASAHSHTTYGRGVKPGKPVQALPARPGRRIEIAGEVARYLGALSILLVGVIHAQQYYDAYFSFVPTIGRLFLHSFIGSGVVGITLIVRVASATNVHLRELTALPSAAADHFDTRLSRASIDN